MTNDETRTTKFLDLERPQWRFLLKWVLASAVGGTVGAFVAGTVYWSVGWTVARAVARAVGGGGPDAVLGAVLGVIPDAVFGAVFGTMVGTAQWMVLRKRIHRSGWWVLASAVGWAVGQAVSRVVALFVVDTAGLDVGWAVVGGAMVGAVLGTAQWMVLRKRVHRAGWWVLASAVAVRVAYVGMNGARAVARAMGGVVPDSVLGAVLGVMPDTMGWVVGGTITGYVLIALLRHPIPKARAL
jgi:uncharacterized integral membrane protein